MKLSDIVADIDDSAVYLVADLAALAGCSATSVHVLIATGVLPRSPEAGRGHPHSWTGQQIRQAAARQAGAEVTPAIPADRTAESRYRLGDRSPVATEAHNASTTQWRRRIADAVFSAPARERLLKLIGAGVPVEDAAAVVGVNVQQVYGRARRDEEFAERLDDAAATLCIDSSRELCGRPAGYRSGCRATECRRGRAERSREERGTTTPALQIEEV